MKRININRSIVNSISMENNYSDPNYFAPSVMEPSVEKYMQHYYKQGIYQAVELTPMEKEIISLQGKYDNDGNQYGVIWTPEGRPICTKTDKQGFEYQYDEKLKKYWRFHGCLNRIFLEDKINPINF